MAIALEVPGSSSDLLNIRFSIMIPYNHGRRFLERCLSEGIRDALFCRG